MKTLSLDSERLTYSEAKAIVKEKATIYEVFEQQFGLLYKISLVLEVSVLSKHDPLSVGRTTRSISFVHAMLR